MTRPLTREEAVRILGVPPSADRETVKRAYRRLVRSHHPDAGGDPATFHDLQRAYERLASEDAPTPVVVTARPSRPPVPFVDEREAVDLAAVDWDVPAPADGDALDMNRLAVWLVADADAPLRRIAATSRAPGSRLNGVAHHLAGELTSRLSVGPTTDDRGREVLAIEVVGATRRARRAIDGARAGDGWVRTRRSSSSALQRTLLPSTDPRATAVRAAIHLDELLMRLTWPLPHWRAVGTATPR